jgi:hypothetical protein
MSRVIYIHDEAGQCVSGFKLGGGAGKSLEKVACASADEKAAPPAKP